MREGDGTFVVLLVLLLGVGVVFYFKKRSSSPNMGASVPGNSNVTLTPNYWVPKIPGIPPAFVEDLGKFEKATVGKLEYGQPQPAIGSNGKLCPCGTTPGGTCKECGSAVGVKVYSAIGSGAKKVGSVIAAPFKSIF